MNNETLLALLKIYPKMRVTLELKIDTGEFSRGNLPETVKKTIFELGSYALYTSNKCDCAFLKAVHPYVGSFYIENDCTSKEYTTAHYKYIVSKVYDGSEVYDYAED